VIGAGFGIGLFEKYTGAILGTATRWRHRSAFCCWS